MFLGNKRVDGHQIFGNKRGLMVQLGMKEKTMSMLKPRGHEHDGKEKEKKSHLER